MAFIWDYVAKQKIYYEFQKKLHLIAKDQQWCAESVAKKTNKPLTDTKKWNLFLDEIECIRIIRDPLSGWEYEEQERMGGRWKSLNFPGFIHVSNPIWPGNFHKSSHLIRISKEIAEKIRVLGMP